jgi:hypothetical protein
MRGVIGFSLTLITSFGSMAQQLMLPRESKIYPDSIAIYWNKFSEAQQSTAVTIMIDSPFGDNYFKTNTTDSIVIAPYYLSYDNEGMIFLYLQSVSKQRSKYIEQFAKLKPLKKK